MVDNRCPVDKRCSFATRGCLSEVEYRLEEYSPTEESIKFYISIGKRPWMSLTSTGCPRIAKIGHVSAHFPTQSRSESEFVNIELEKGVKRARILNDPIS